MAYNAVRLARGVQLPRLPARLPNRPRISNIYLLDEWYDGTLNWLLSRRTKLNIEQRSSWLKGAGNEVCCEVKRASSSADPERIPLKEEQRIELERADPSLKIVPFIPNAAHFERIFQSMNPTARPSLPAAVPAPVQITPAPSAN